MAEYINKEHLDRKFIVKMLSPTTTTIFDAKDIIDELQPADVIERYKIDKAIAEIETLKKYEMERFSEDVMYHKALKKCLEIIKRNIGE